MLTVTFLAVYLINLVLLVFLVAFAAPHKYQSFSFVTHWMSNLGEKGSKSFWLFNAPLFIWGVLNIIIGIIFKSVLLQTFLFSNLTIFFFFSLSGGIILVSFFPTNKNRVLHGIAGGILFISITFFCFAMISNIAVSGWPGSLTALFLAELMIIFILSVILTLSRTRLHLKYGWKNIRNLVEVRKIEKSFFLKNGSVWEWLVFLFSVIYLFSVSADMFSIHLANVRNALLQIWP